MDTNKDLRWELCEFGFLRLMYKDNNLASILMHMSTASSHCPPIIYEDEETINSFYTWEEFKNKFGCDYSDLDKLKQVIEHYCIMMGYLYGYE